MCNTVFKILILGPEFSPLTHLQTKYIIILLFVLQGAEKRILQELENDVIVEKWYYDGSTECNMRTWYAIVRWHIDSGKEVCWYVCNFDSIQIVLFQCHSKISNKRTKQVIHDQAGYSLQKSQAMDQPI